MPPPPTHVTRTKSARSAVGARWSVAPVCVSVVVHRGEVECGGVASRNHLMVNAWVDDRHKFESAEREGEAALRRAPCGDLRWSVVTGPGPRQWS